MINEKNKFLTVSWLSGFLSAEIFISTGEWGVQMPPLTYENSHFLRSGPQEATLVMTDLRIYEIVMIYMCTHQSWWYETTELIINCNITTIAFHWNTYVSSCAYHMIAYWPLKAFKVSITMTQLMNFLSKCWDTHIFFIPCYAPSITASVTWPLFYMYWEWLHGKLLKTGISKASWGLLYYCVQSLARDNGSVQW